MTVRRIVPNLQVSDPTSAHRFYADLLDLEIVMDHGWLVTFAAKGSSSMPQVSFATEGGSGTPVPALSIEWMTWTKSMGVRRLPAQRSSTISPTSPGACGASSCAIRSATSSTSCRIERGTTPGATDQTVVSALATSATRSSGCSMPIDRRMVDSSTPIRRRTSIGTPE
ncbi:hypothetical protein ABIE78_000988 [Sinorhizobium fredii]